MIEYVRYGLSENTIPDFLKKSVVYLCLYSSVANTATASLYWTPVSRFYRWRDRSDLRTCGSSIDPYAYRQIDPQRLKQFTGREGTARSKRYIGSVKGGDWDVREPVEGTSDPLRGRTKRFEDHLVFRSFEAHFDEGKPWEETELIKHVLGEVRSGNRCWGSNSPHDVFERCDRFDALYETIAEDGYKTKRELLGIEPGRFVCRLRRGLDRHGTAEHITRTGHHPVRGFRSIIANEVMVDVSRNGEPLFVDGRHRLAIAKLLGLETIPVVVLVRHREWVNKVRKSSCTEQELLQP